MRIAILSPFYPYRGGIAQFSASLYRELEKEHEVKAFTFTRQYPSFLFPGKTQYVGSDDLVDKIEALRVLDSINPLSYLRTIEAINGYQPDLVILRYWMPFFGPSLGFIGRRLRCNVIAIIDNAVPHERRFSDRPFSRYFLPSNDGLVVMSESVRQDIVELISSPPPIIVLSHPVYNHFGEKLDRTVSRERLGIGKDQKILLFFGIIRDYKGLDILIEAFSYLDSSYSLLIAGECYGSFEVYSSIIEKNKNKDRIHVFNEYIPDHKVSLFFSASDVCILPYRTATQSGITATALHFDLPVIATDTGGLRQSVADVGMGKVIDDFSPKTLSDAIVQYFNFNEPQRFRDQIIIHKEENSWTRFVNRLVEFSNGLTKTGAG